MRLSGLFIDEYVAGSYIIKLLIPSIFLFVLFFKNNIYLIFFVLLSLVSILITGDRAPAFLFFLAFIFFIIFNKNLDDNKDWNSFLKLRYSSKTEAEMIINKALSDFKQ